MHCNMGSAKLITSQFFKVEKQLRILLSFVLLTKPMLQTNLENNFDGSAFDIRHRRAQGCDVHDDV